MSKNDKTIISLDKKELIRKLLELDAINKFATNDKG